MDVCEIARIVLSQNPGWFVVEETINYGTIEPNLCETKLVDYYVAPLSGTASSVELNEYIDILTRGISEYTATCSSYGRSDGKLTHFGYIMADGEKETVLFEAEGYTYKVFAWDSVRIRPYPNALVAFEMAKKGDPSSSTIKQVNVLTKRYQKRLAYYHARLPLLSS